jgi:hypothetical protein
MPLKSACTIHLPGSGLFLPAPVSCITSCDFQGLALSGSCTIDTAGRRLWPKKSGHDPVPSSSKRLKNLVPHIRYGPPAPGWMGGTTDLKELNPCTTCTSLFSTTMDSSGQDFATYQPDLTPPCDPARHAPRPLVATSGVSSTSQVTPELGSLDGRAI